MEKKYVRFPGKVQPMVAWIMDCMDGKVNQKKIESLVIFQILKVI